MLFCSLLLQSWDRQLASQPPDPSAPLTPRAPAGNQNSDSAGPGIPMSTVSSFTPGACSNSLGLPNHPCPELLALTYACVVLLSISFELISKGKTIPLTKQGWITGTTGNLHLDPLYKLCVHTQLPKTLPFLLCSLHGMAIAYLKHPGSLMWQEEIQSTHTHTHVRARTHTRTNIPQELICTPARAGNGGSRREIIVATSRVFWVDRPWLFYWFHCGGVWAWSSLVCSLLSTALRSIWSTLPFLLNTQSPLRRKNLHILHWIFKFEQSLRTQRNWVIVKKVATKFCLSFL